MFLPPLVAAPVGLPNIRSRVLGFNASVCHLLLPLLPVAGVAGHHVSDVSLPALPSSFLISAAQAFLPATGEASEGILFTKDPPYLASCPLHDLDSVAGNAGDSLLLLSQPLSQFRPRRVNVTRPCVLRPI